jgi:hypothetical protein
MVALAACSSSSSWFRLSQAVSFAVWFWHASSDRQRPSRRWFVSLATLFANRFLPCLVAAQKYRLAQDCLLARFAKRPRRTLARSPRAVPWENALPWATVMISHTAAAVPVRDDRGRGSACAKAVDAATNPGARTSVTARTPTACVWSGAGRQRGDKPNDARTRPPKPSTPRHNVRAVSVPPLRRKNLRSLKFQRRVVTQQTFCCRHPCATDPGAMNRR